MEQSYQGWSNYQTWCVSLWLNNDYSLYCQLQEIVQRYDQSQADELAEAIKDFVEEIMPDLEGLSADLMGFSLGKVNWQEIAESELS